MPKAPAPAHVAASLEAARRACEAAGATWTEPRRRTYELLLQARRPPSADELIAAYRTDGRPVGPPTVYRALHVLRRRGLVHRLDRRNTFVAAPGRSDGRGLALLVCRCCGRADELRTGLPRQALARAVQRGYRVEQVVVEMSGLCPDCR